MSMCHSGLCYARIRSMIIVTYFYLVWVYILLQAKKMIIVMGKISIFMLMLMFVFVFVDCYSHVCHSMHVPLTIMLLVVGIVKLGYSCIECHHIGQQMYHINYYCQYCIDDHQYWHCYCYQYRMYFLFYLIQLAIAVWYENIIHEISIASMYGSYLVFFVSRLQGVMVIDVSRYCCSCFICRFVYEE